MDALLRDLIAHGAWADAEHWRALEAHPGALDDGALRRRLHHICAVQRAFFDLSRGAALRLRPLEDYADMRALRDDARACHAELAAWSETVSDARLDETITLPWFRDSPARLPVSQALTQAVLHSHYHRGQNATRLRELGGEPPLVDYVVWIWRGRPAAAWP